jgi:hydrogenase maturation protease
VEALNVIEKNASSGGSILVIGYGNTLRGDDGVGQHVALAISKWRMPGLNVKAAHQLTAELAEPVSQADLVIFVDGQVAGEEGDVTVHRLEPSPGAGFAGHTSDPRGVLALALAVYGRYAPAWLVLVPGDDFSVREDLSATAFRGAGEAIVRIAALIDAHGSKSLLNRGPGCPEPLQR